MSNSRYCPIRNSECTIQRPLTAGSICFIAIPFKDEWKDTRETVRKVLKKFNINPYVADEDITAGREILCKVCEKITNSDFGVIEVGTVNPNVMFEFGLILGRRKPVFILFNKALSKEGHFIPTDIIALERIEYKNQGSLEKKLTKGFKQCLSMRDIRQKRLSVMMELARGNAKDRDFSTTASLLEIIAQSLLGEGRFNGDFTELLTDIIGFSEKDPIYQLRFSLSLVKFSALGGDTESVEAYLDFIFRKLSSISKEAISSSDQFINPKIGKRLLTFAEKGKLFEYRRPMDMVLWEIERQNIIGHYAYLWHVLLNISDQKKFLTDVGKYVKEYLKKEPVTYSVLGILRERAERRIRYAAWIQSVIELGQNRTLINAARKIKKDLDLVLKKYFSSYGERKERVIKIAKRRAKRT